MRFSVTGDADDDDDNDDDYSYVPLGPQQEHLYKSIVGPASLGGTKQRSLAAMLGPEWSLFISEIEGSDIKVSLDKTE